MRSQQYQITNGRGQKLAAILDLPVNGEPKAYALFAHCFTCNKNLKAVANISRALTQAGLALLRIDFTGLGESEGEFQDTNFSTNVADLISAADFLRNKFSAPQILIGHSLGGAATLTAAKNISEARAVVTIGTPSEPAHVLRHFSEHLSQLEKEGCTEVKLHGRDFQFSKQFVDDVSSIDLMSHIQNLDKALLVLHSPLDDTVDVSHAGKIFQAAKHPKSFVSLDSADHLLTKADDAKYVGRLIAAWAERYLTFY